ncbi:hypothetical protein CPB86DRAFT_780383 [Serendipita vermifera]|nr:hypothetical protein CPB86DRAFT_780383 [Serendipita vermifera]
MENPIFSELTEHPTIIDAAHSPLIELPEDLIVSVISYLDVASLVRLAGTCKFLANLIDRKTVWLNVVETIRLSRPLPLSYRVQTSRGAASELPLSDLRAAAIRATQLEDRFSQSSIKPSRIDKVTIPLHENDSIIWVWNLDANRYLMTYTRHGWFTCRINATGQCISFQPWSKASCWDFDLDSEGVTVIFNSGPDSNPWIQSIEIHRIDLKTASSSLIKIESAVGWVRSNFLEEDIAGCVLTDDRNGTLKMYLVNWRTKKSAVIDTGVNSPDRFSASTTKTYLLMCTCTHQGDVFDAWSYSYEFLKECTERASSVDVPYRATALPQFHHITHYLDPENVITTQKNEIDLIIPTSRGLWTGDKAVLCMWADIERTSLYMTYSLLTDGTNLTHFTSSIGESHPAGEGSNQPASLAIDSLSPIFTQSDTKRGFVYAYEKNKPVALGAQWQFLYGFGQWGKQAVWIEGLVDTEMQCRLATFNQESDSDRSDIKTNISTIDYDQADFRWTDLNCMQLDDASGILTCGTVDEIWQLHFG